MAETIPMALVGTDLSARVGGDHLCRFFDDQDFKTQPIINDHDHLILLELYLAGLKLSEANDGDWSSRDTLEFWQSLLGA